MAPDTPLTDDFVVEILRQEASRNNNLAATDPKSLLFLSGRPPRSNAPKPNTRFLRNVLRATDSHNAALKAREEADSRARQRRLRRADDDNDDDDDGNALHHRRPHNLSGRDVRKSRESHKGYEERGGHSGRLSRSRSPQSPRHDRAEYSQRKRSRHEDDGREERTVRRRTRSRSCSRSRSPRERKHHRHRRRTQSPSHSRAHRHERSHTQRHKEGQEKEEEQQQQQQQRRTHRSSKDDPDSDSSDPLESLIGPLPPPKVLPRGRGAHRTSAIDTRFSTDYNPADDAELQAETPEEGSDWELALGALRDRSKWLKHRADRLRAAGFTNEEVWKFEDAESSRSNGEKDASDVRWRKRGEGREWDRGKVVDGDRVDVAPKWGRLNGT